MNKSKGFTIIEIIIFILVLALALVPLLAVFGNALYSSGSQQSMRTAAFLAQGLMEEITGRDFEEITSFSLAGGELSPEHPRFSAEVEAVFVLPGNLNAPVEEVTNFKRIETAVKWNGGKISLVTVRAGDD